MTATLNAQDKLVFGHDAERCARTGRIFESGSGAQSRQEQSERFLREQAAENDRPKEGDYCLQTGRAYDCSVGALSKSQQTAGFLAELPPAVKAQRQADADALLTVEPVGRA